MSNGAPNKSIPPAPMPSGSNSANTKANRNSIDKDQIIADLRRQLEMSDISSNASSVSSGPGRNRRRRNKNKKKSENQNQNSNMNQGGGKVYNFCENGNLGTAPVVRPEKGSKPVRLQLGLNLDAELELKAKLRGDITISLVVEKRGRRALQPNETAKKLHKPGTLEVFDTCYVHLTMLDFRRRWLEKDVSASLTAAAAFAVAGVGMLVGFFWGWAVGREGMRGRCAL